MRQFLQPTHYDIARRYQYAAPPKPDGEGQQSDLGQPRYRSRLGGASAGGHCSAVKLARVQSLLVLVTIHFSTYHLVSS